MMDRVGVCNAFLPLPSFHLGDLKKSRLLLLLTFQITACVDLSSVDCYTDRTSLYHRNLRHIQQMRC